MTMTRAFVICVAVLFAVCGLAVVGLCAGGVYVDDLRVTNNGAQVLLDNFETGKLDGWTKLTGAELAANEQNKSLAINRHGNYAATAYRTISIDKPGLVEISWFIFVAPVGEQYDCKKGGACTMSIRLLSGMSASSNAGVPSAALILNPCETTCRAGLAPANSFNATAKTKSPVLSLGRWVPVVFRLDSANGKATLLVNGREAVSMSYDPSSTKSIRQIGFVSQFGDGSNRSK